MKVIQIEWVDSCGTGGWEDYSEIENQTPCKVISTGYILRETKDFITIYQSIDEKNEQIDNSITIPKFAITKTRFLK